MKLEVGKVYVTQGGHVVGPLWSEPDDESIFYADQTVDQFLPMWKEDGKADFFYNPEDNFPAHDIVKEFVGG